VTAWYFYIRSPETCPSSWPRSIDILYQFLLNKWYFDELYDFIFVRPASGSVRSFWKQGDGRVIDGFGPDGIAARARHHRPGRETADRLSLPLRLRDADRNCSA
jgi:NADH-quinone oxidoreductase subunit L